MKRLCLLATVCAAASAQQWVNPHFDTHRLDYRDLGYPNQNLIPADNSRITALLAHSNGLVYGATSGRTQSYLFLYNRYINKVRPLGKIANEKGVFHGLTEGREGKIYIGTGLNQLAPVKMTQNFPVVGDGAEIQLWNDIRKPYQGYAGGHIYEYDPRTGDVKTYREEDPAPLKDLGIPAPGNSVHAMTLSPDKRTMYVIGYPDAHLFVFDLATGKSSDAGELLSGKVYSGPERDWRSVPRALYCDPKRGDVYTSGNNGAIVRYSLETRKIALTAMQLPGEYHEGLSSRDHPVVESFEPDGRGNLYAGTNDGFLVRFNPAREETIVIGKPRISRRMRAMKLAPDGRLYMITGEPERSCKLHAYNTGRGGFQELGVFSVDRSPYYSRRAYQFDAMAIGADGTVFCGESDRGGKLFLYLPGPGTFPTLLNPTNPRLERQRPGTPALIQEKL